MNPECDVAAIANVVVRQRHRGAVLLGVSHLLVLIRHKGLQSTSKAVSSDVTHEDLGQVWVLQC
jgi:hypothetical protein